MPILSGAKAKINAQKVNLYLKSLNFMLIYYIQTWKLEPVDNLSVNLNCMLYAFNISYCLKVTFLN